MNDIHCAATADRAGAVRGSALQRRPSVPCPAGGDAGQRDRDFVALLDAYRASGGLVRRHELPQRCRPVAAVGGEQALAGLLAARQVFDFHWHDSWWLPMFQFEPQERRIAAALPQVLAELGKVFDGWDIAAWFVRAHPALHGMRPIDQLSSNPAAVRDAAREDRSIADQRSAE